MEAVNEEVVDIHRVDAALKDAKQVKNLIDPQLWARGEALIKENSAKCIQEREAVISSLVRLSMGPTNDQAHSTYADVHLPPCTPSDATNGTGMGDHGDDRVDSLSKDIECMVCLSARRNACIVPCGHICMCYECGLEVQTKRGVCPLCRGCIECLMEIMC